MGTLVQNARANALTVAYASNVTSGNLLVTTFGSYHASLTVTNLTDTRGTTWTQAGTILRGTGGRAPIPLLVAYYGIAPSSGANTVTFTLSATPDDTSEIKVWEISGIDTTTPLNGTQSNSGTTAFSTAVTVDTPNLVTTAPGFIIKTLQEWCWVTHNEASGTPTTGWTEYGDTAFGADSAYRNETSTGTFTGGFSFTNTSDGGGGGASGYCVRIMAFSDAGAPPSGTLMDLERSILRRVYGRVFGRIN